MLATIDVGELSRAQANLGAIPYSQVLFDKEPASAPAFLQVIGASDIQAALATTNAIQLPVGPLMCHRARDVTLCGSGYAFHGDALVVDGSHLSDVAVEWVQRPMPDSPLANPILSERWVNGLCVVIAAPGHLIYGHWLIDFIPRLMLARLHLGAAFADAKIPLPHDTPKWALRMMALFAGVRDDQVAFFQRGTERLVMSDALFPSYAHHDYTFHPSVRAVFAEVGPKAEAPGRRKICISRMGFERSTHGVQKLFGDRLRFEEIARSFGYDVLCPETLPLADQIALFRSASHVVGEYGSALHNTVFSPEGCRVGYIRCPNAIQLRISALWAQPGVIVIPDVDFTDGDGVVNYTLSDSSITDFFRANEAGIATGRNIRT